MAGICLWWMALSSGSNACSETSIVRHTKDHYFASYGLAQSGIRCLGLTLSNLCQSQNFIGPLPNFVVNIVLAELGGLYRSP